MATLEPSRQLSDRHLRVMGLIISEWSFLESVINLGLWGFLGINQEHGRAVTSFLGVRAQLNLIEAIARRTFGDTKTFEGLRPILGRIENARSERNKVAHAIWYASDDGGSPEFGFAEMQRRGQFISEVEQMKVSTLEKIAREIVAVTGDFADFLNENVPYPES